MSEPSPEAKQAVASIGVSLIEGKLRLSVLEGIVQQAIDAATAKLREKLADARQILGQCVPHPKSRLTSEELQAFLAHQQPPQDEQQFVYIERYFPKGYNPNDEPWRSISKHYRIAKKQMAVLERMLSDKDKELEAQPDPKQPSMTTPDVEKIAREAAEILVNYIAHTPTSSLNDEKIGLELTSTFNRVIAKALTQARAPLVGLLRQCKPHIDHKRNCLANAEDGFPLELRKLYNLMAKIDAALTGTEEK